jgi:hypothetical protein
VHPPPPRSKSPQLFAVSQRKILRLNPSSRNETFQLKNIGEFA